MAWYQDPINQGPGPVVVNDQLILYSDDKARYVARDLKGVVCSTNDPQDACRFLRNRLRRRPNVKTAGHWDIPGRAKLWVEVSDLFSLIRF